MDYLAKSISQKVDVDIARWTILTSPFYKKSRCRHGEMYLLDKWILQNVDVNMARITILKNQLHKKMSTWPEVLSFVDF